MKSKLIKLTWVGHGECDGAEPRQESLSIKILMKLYDYYYDLLLFNQNIFNNIVIIIIIPESWIELN